MKSKTAGPVAPCTSCFLATQQAAINSRRRPELPRTTAIGNHLSQCAVQINISCLIDSIAAGNGDPMGVRRDFSVKSEACVSLSLSV